MNKPAPRVPEAEAALDAVAHELGLQRRQVAAVVRLVAEGNTVPFIARYRKEATGELDEVQIRAVAERHAYREALAARRQALIESLGERGLLTPELHAALIAADTKAALEDLYLPFRPKRRTRAAIARERGLLPLAERILAQPPQGDPEREAAAFIDAEAGVTDAAAALAGACDIVAETVAERADVRAIVREALSSHGRLAVALNPRAPGDTSNYAGFDNAREALATVPSHRYLAICRGEREGALRVHLDIDEERLAAHVLTRVGLEAASPFAGPLRAAVVDGLARLLLPSVGNEIRADLKERADLTAVGVFARNLENLLLAAPLGERPVIGVDPGLRTGCKAVALDETGRHRGRALLHLHAGVAAAAEARERLSALVERHRPAAIAVGNGTGGREAEAFVREVVRSLGPAAPPVVPVSEAGASVYSASDVARAELPDLDVSERGAVSIARRLQDPLAELVKIEPKALGVGQYQHDVDEALLQGKLDEVVEDCVNRVGVEVNTASPALLARVAGIGPALARRIVERRQTSGVFRSRRELREVTGLGPRTFEQAAGFLRVRGGSHPLDRSAVHPERYALVERMAKDVGVPLAELVGNPEAAKRIPLERYVDAEVGLPTLRDIAAELQKPGRDPRAQFEAPAFRDDVRTVADLKVGMQLAGVVTNVTAFGAFVDIGVHRDGLVHVSELADRFIRDPHEAVHVGQTLSVRVLDVDVARQRISLSARSPDAARRPAAAGPAPARGAGPPPAGARPAPRPAPPAPFNAPRRGASAAFNAPRPAAPRPRRP